jgi:CBS domain-containing protein
MFLGASLGAAYGKILAATLPVTVNIAAPPAYAMVGMAAVLAGSVRAPLTSILLLFELTRDYRIVLPLMAAVGLSIWLVDRLQTTITPGLNLQQMGLSVEKDPNLETFKQLPVAAAMHQMFLKLPSDASVVEAGLALTNSHSRSALVVDESEQLIGIVTLQDINRAISLWERYTSSLQEGLVAKRLEAEPLNNNPTHQKVRDICTLEILYAYQDELVAEALDRMAARGLRQLPVIERGNPQQVVGLLDQEGIALACSITATREALHSYLSRLPAPKELPLPSMEKIA